MWSEHSRSCRPAALAVLVVPVRAGRQRRPAPRPPRSARGVRSPAAPGVHLAFPERSPAQSGITPTRTSGHDPRRARRVRQWSTPPLLAASTSGSSPSTHSSTSRPRPTSDTRRSGSTARPGTSPRRAAAMGRVGSEVVLATFFNFKPELVRAALPSAWDAASPEQVLAERLAGADETLRRIFGDLIDDPGLPESAPPRPARRRVLVRPRVVRCYAAHASAAVAGRATPRAVPRDHVASRAPGRRPRRRAHAGEPDERRVLVPTQPAMPCICPRASSS